MLFSPTETWVPDKPHTIWNDQASEPFFLVGKKQIAREFDHWVMYHSDTFMLLTGVHMLKSGTLTIDSQEGAGIVYQRDRLFIAGPNSLSIRKASDWAWPESNVAELIQAIPVAEMPLFETSEELSKPAFKVEDAGSVLLWKPIPDAAAKRRGQAMAEAIKKHLASVEKARLEETMKEIRGRPW